MLKKSQKHIHVIGRGAFSSMGESVSAHWQTLLCGKSVIDKGLGSVADSWIQPNFLPQNLTAEKKDYLCSSKAAYFAIRALSEAFREASLENETAPVHDETVFFVATTTGQMPYWDQSMIQYLHHQIDKESFLKRFRHHSLSQFSQDVGNVFGISAQNTFVISSACSASTQALGMATALLQKGRYKKAVVLGVEVLCDLTIEGFRSLQLLSEEPCRPFDLNRKGINLAEGAFALVLTNENTSQKLAQLTGFGWTTDSFHMTGPHPEGNGSYRAMLKALQGAGRNTHEIDYLYAHGTGSMGNDVSESLAIENLFQNQVCPPVLSTKNIHGHTLGACGALETILAISSIENKMIPASFGFNTVDPKIKIPVSAANTSHKVNVVLKNTLGFGGVNAALLIERCGY